MSHRTATSCYCVHQRWQWLGGRKSKANPTVFLEVNTVEYVFISSVGNKTWLIARVPIDGAILLMLFLGEGGDLGGV